MYAIIGDVHGCFNTLCYLFDKIFAYKIHRFIFVGDLIDRGDYSKEVINFVINLSEKHDVILIKGNHEDMMLDYVFSEGRYDSGVWFYNGGYSTVRSFSENLYYASYLNFEDISYELKLICEKELKFLKKAKLYDTITVGKTKFFISHAGVEFENISPYKQLDYVKDEFSKKVFHPYLWAREVDGFENRYDDFIFVHGHTPLKEVYINRTEKDEIISINIDTGCVYGGKLTAMILDDNGNLKFISERYKG